MDSDDPDLEAFESNLRRILRERELGKAAAALVDSEVLPDDQETSAEWKFEGHIYFSAGRWSSGKNYEDAVRAAVEDQYLPTVPVPVHRMEIFYNSAAEPDRELLKLPIRGYVQAKSASRGLWKKWIGAAALEWEKIQGGIPLHDRYIFDTKEKSDPTNTNRFLLSYGKLSFFRVCGRAWTFSGTVRVDSPWDDSPGEDLVEIARSKFVEAEGARERPDAIEYLSVHCDLSPLILGSPSEAQKVPVRGFLQTANPTWNSLWERWLPNFAWRPVRGGLCGNKDFQKALAEIQLDKSTWFEMLAQGELRRNNAGRRAARASSSSSGSSRAQSDTSSSPGQVRTRTAACMQAKATAHIAHTTRQAASAGGASRSAGAAKRKASTSRSSSLSRPVSKRRSLPTARIPKKVISPCPFAIAAQLRPTYESAGFARQRRGGNRRRPRCRRRERWRRRRCNPTCLYSRHVHESIRLWLPCPY